MKVLIAFLIESKWEPPCTEHVESLLEFKEVSIMSYKWYLVFLHPFSQEVKVETVKSYVNIIVSD